MSPSHLHDSYIPDHDAMVARIVAWLRSIGLPVRETTLDCPTFMPGVSIGGGALLYDQPRLTYPGDLLHEAGHMAVLPPQARLACTGDAGGDAAAEIAAIAWSYAAALDLGINPRVVLHAKAYSNGGHSIADNFDAGAYFGVPLLQWFGMTKEPPVGTIVDAPGVYPRMSQWLRLTGDPA